jgi:hypothetical protein
VEDIADRAKDPEFLNSLQAGVNNWIRNIQKVREPDPFVSAPVYFTLSVEFLS